MAAMSLAAFQKWMWDKQWVKGAVNYDEDLHFSTFYLRASHARYTAPLYQGYSSIIAFYEGFNECYYLLKSECRRTAGALLKKAIQQPTWLPKILRAIGRQSDALTHVFSAESSPAGLARLSKADILALYDKHATRQRVLYRYARLPEALDRGDAYFSMYLREYLRIIGIASAECEATFAVLSQPLVPSVLAQELLDFEAIVQEARANAHTLASHAQGRVRMFLPPELLKRLREHREKWKYLAYHGYGRRELAGLGQYIDRLVEQLNNPGGNGHAGGLQQRASQAKEERHQLLKTLRMDGAHRALFAVYPEIGAAKLYRRHAQLRNFYYLDMLLAEIANRIGVNEWTVRCMLPEEIVASLKAGALVSPSILERTTGCMYALLPKREWIMTASSGKELHQFFQARTTSCQNGNVLKGTPASRGMVVGPCKVIIRADDHREEFPPGTIVVSESTDPDLVGFLKNAGGVLTEQGGVTCHAAIICRELGVPTVIGIEGLLERVRDGDIVEVDGHRGLVTLVQDKAAPPPRTAFLPEEARSPNVVGTKAYNLGVVRSLGFLVPDYVLVSCEGITALIQRPSRSCCQRLRQWIRQQLNLPAGSKVALRSSALQEDGESGSHAGEFHSLLHIGQDQLPRAFGQFMESNRQSRNGAAYRGSIIVQRMIEADYAGVCLTVDCRTGNANTVIMEFVAGSNESITQGTVIPDRVVINRLTGDILECQERSQQSLPAAMDFGYLVQQFLTLEAHFGKPLDIEWALADRKLYILQARPIVQPAQSMNRIA
jgi:phosphohistidine swiveling domain-containing protein